MTNLEHIKIVEPFGNENQKLFFDHAGLIRKKKYVFQIMCRNEKKNEILLWIN